MTSVTGSKSRGASRISSDGLTLIEILISVAILATAVVFVLQALAKGAYALTTATHRFRVYELASEQMAQAELAFEQGATPSLRGAWRVERETYPWHLDVTPDDPEHPDIASAALTVRWSQGRESREIHVATRTHLVPPSP